VADESEPVGTMTLRKARASTVAQDFVQDNQGLASMRPCPQAIESLVRETEAMTVSARTHQPGSDLPERGSSQFMPNV
jgi:hypothetical protein